MNPPLNKTTTARLLAPAVWLLRGVGFLLRAVWCLFAAFVKLFFFLAAPPSRPELGLYGERLTDPLDEDPAALLPYHEYLDRAARRDHERQMSFYEE